MISRIQSAYSQSFSRPLPRKGRPRGDSVTEKEFSKLLAEAEAIQDKVDISSLKKEKRNTA